MKPAVSSCQVPPDVGVIVSDYPGHDVTGGDSLRSLGGHKHSSLLDEVVNVLRTATNGVGSIVVGHEVDLVQLQEFVVKSPGGVNDDLES